jgi:hypothetical protein
VLSIVGTITESERRRGQCFDSIVGCSSALVEETKQNKIVNEQTDVFSIEFIVGDSLFDSAVRSHLFELLVLQIIAALSKPGQSSIQHLKKGSDRAFSEGVDDCQMNQSRVSSWLPNKISHEQRSVHKRRSSKFKFEVFALVPQPLFRGEWRMSKRNRTMKSFVFNTQVRVLFPFPVPFSSYSCCLFLSCHHFTSPPV